MMWPKLHPDKAIVYHADKFSNRSGYGSDPTHFLIGGTGCQYTRTVNSGTVRWKSHNPSELCELAAGCPAGPSVDSYNALVFAV